MKYKNPKIINNKTYNNSINSYDADSKALEEQILKSLANYLSNNYLYGDSISDSPPFKIVDYHRISNRIEILNYSPDFLRMFNGFDDHGITYCEINHSIASLKNRQLKLYEALYYLWGWPITVYNCHKGTVYRRLHKALKFIATDLGILKSF